MNVQLKSISLLWVSHDKSSILLSLCMPSHRCCILGNFVNGLEQCSRAKCLLFSLFDLNLNTSTMAKRDKEIHDKVCVRRSIKVNY